MCVVCVVRCVYLHVVCGYECGVYMYVHGVVFVCSIHMQEVCGVCVFVRGTHGYMVCV